MVSTSSSSSAHPSIASWPQQALTKCTNCDRGVIVDGTALRENGQLFCNHDCYWSATLDVNNSRLKKRKGKKRNRRLRTEIPVNSEGANEAVDYSPCISAPVAVLVPGDVNHAMFALHTNVLNGASFNALHCGS